MALIEQVLYLCVLLLDKVYSVSTFLTWRSCGIRHSITVLFGHEVIGLAMTGTAVWLMLIAGLAFISVDARPTLPDTSAVTKGCDNSTLEVTRGK